MNDIKASIILLAYNHEDRIGRAIESVLRQDCPWPFEIVVADDASSDRTREIAEGYARKYPDKVRVLPAQPNRGLVGNYFDAVEECKGEYIGDCAGDDEWLSTSRLRLQIEKLDSDRSLTAVFTDVEKYEVGADGKIRTTLYSEDALSRQWQRERVAGKEILSGVLTQTPIFPYLLSSALYRKDILEKALHEKPELIRIPEMGVEDVPVIAALAARGDAAYLPVVGYRYYISGESLSNNLSAEKEYRFYTRVLKGVRILARAYGLSDREMKSFYSRWINHLAPQLRHSRRADLIPELRAWVKECGINLTLRARVHLLLTRLGM